MKKFFHLDGLKKLIKKQQLIKYLQNYHGKFNDDTTVIKVKIRGA